MSVYEGYEQIFTLKSVKCTLGCTEVNEWLFLKKWITVSIIKYFCKTKKNILKKKKNFLPELAADWPVQNIKKPE